MFEDLRKVLGRRCYPLKFEYVRSEMNTQFANIATPNEVVVTTTFTIEFGTVGGEFHICMPYAMIEPIRDVLYSSLQGEHMEVDKRWVRLLSQQVQIGRRRARRQPRQRRSSRSTRCCSMKVGDVIPLDIPKPI